MGTSYHIELPSLGDVHIVHCHIPRTAGIAVDYYFRSIFGDERCVRLGNADEFSAINEPGHHFHQFEWKYMSAHLPAYALIELMGGRKFFMFSVVREPLARELSAFKNIVDHNYKEHHGISTFDDYLSFKESRASERNQQCAYIQIGDDHESPVIAKLLNFISAGGSIFSIDKLFLLQEYIRTSLSTNCIIEHRNVSSIKMELTSEQIVRLNNLVSCDVELYNLVVASEKFGSLLGDWRIHWREGDSALSARTESFER